MVKTGQLPFCNSKICNRLQNISISRFFTWTIDHWSKTDLQKNDTFMANSISFLNRLQAHFFFLLFYAKYYNIFSNKYCQITNDINVRCCLMTCIMGYRTRGLCIRIVPFSIKLVKTNWKRLLYICKKSCVAVLTIKSDLTFRNKNRM